MSVGQAMDNFKVLTKEGKDGMGRDCIKSYDDEAKGRIEIYFKDSDNVACIQKLAQLQEQAMGVAPTKPLTSMPTANADVNAAFPAKDDI